MSNSYPKWPTCLSRLVIFSFFPRSQTGSWSHMVSDSLGRQRKGNLGHKTSIDQARQKHNCVKLRENKQFSHHISRAAPLMDTLTSYQTLCIYFFLMDFPIICFRLSWFAKIIFFQDQGPPRNDICTYTNIQIIFLLVQTSEYSLSCVFHLKANTYLLSSPPLPLLKFFLGSFRSKR